MTGHKRFFQPQRSLILEPDKQNLRPSRWDEWGHWKTRPNKWRLSFRHHFHHFCDDTFIKDVCSPEHVRGSTFGKIYANCCCLNSRGPPHPVTTRRPSNKSIQAGESPPPPFFRAPNQHPQSLPPKTQTLPRLAMRHGSMDDRLMRRKYFYRIAFLWSPENRWQRFYGHGLAELGYFNHFIWAGGCFMGEASAPASLTRTTAPPLAGPDLRLKSWPQTSACGASSGSYQGPERTLMPKRRFRQSGAADVGLKINSGGVNGKANASGSSQRDTINKLSFLPSWPPEPTIGSRTQPSDLTRWTLLPSDPSPCQRSP